MEDSTITELKLPGFRFHPTEEELLSFYLKNMISQKEPRATVIGFLNIYHHDPWDLPGLAKTRIGEREWYFFVPRDKKKGKQGRPNRTTANGFWKATGTDRKVISLSNPKKMIGMKKTMVFYKGRAPRGRKTEWVMNEFRLPDTSSSPTDIVLCKIYRKAMSLKVLEQRVAMEEETSKIRSSLLFSSPVPSLSSSSSSSSMDVKDDHPYDYFPNTQYIDHHQGFVTTAPQMNLEKLEDGQEALVVVEEDSFLIGNHKNKKKEETAAVTSETIRLQFPYGNDKLEDLLQVSKSSVDWTQDPFWTQLRSPICLDNWAFYANTTF